MTERVSSELEALYQEIKARSAQSRAEYLDAMTYGAQHAPKRQALSCSNLAHTYAALPLDDRQRLLSQPAVNLGIVTAYNDMLSAHQPYGEYPSLIKEMARAHGATAQVAGGVPAMCDGITQGQQGMELSLYSRDVIAQATGIALSHAAFDAVICLGICDKIVPGLLMGALHFGYLPTLFLPSGPMTTGMSNRKKSEVRQQFAKGEIDRSALLKAELQCYHSPGTCTFYGTANTNELMLECLGLQLPGASFSNPDSALRLALNRRGVAVSVAMAKEPQRYALATLIDERSILNAMVGVLASGGSTNHTIHLVAIARLAGIQINWDDFQRLSERVPLLARVYPNGEADVNQFHAQGGIQYIIAELLKVGLLFGEARTVVGTLSDYALSPTLSPTLQAASVELHSPDDPQSLSDSLQWALYEPPGGLPDPSVLRPAEAPFSPTGGVVLLEGNLGRAIIKTSAVDSAHYIVEAPAIVFESQQALVDAYHRKELQRDFIAVVRFQGPRANGMPELHQLMPLLGSLQDQGFQVALVTDGRMSGASGKVPAAIHCVPEASMAGEMAKLSTGDRLRLDITRRLLMHCVESETWVQRSAIQYRPPVHYYGGGLFCHHRQSVSTAEEGGSLLT